MYSKFKEITTSLSTYFKGRYYYTNYIEDNIERKKISRGYHFTIGNLVIN